MHDLSCKGLGARSRAHSTNEPQPHNDVYLVLSYS